MAELVEKLVTQWLLEADVGFLTARCTEFNVNVPADKAGNKQYMIRLITRYLYSEALENTADNGKAVWLKLFGELGDVLGKGTPKNEAPDTPPPVQNLGASGGLGGGGADISGDGLGVGGGCFGW